MAGSKSDLKTTANPQPEPNPDRLLEAARASIREARLQAIQTRRLVESAHQRIAQTGAQARARRSLNPVD